MSPCSILSNLEVNISMPSYFSTAGSQHNLIFLTVRALVLYTGTTYTETKKWEMMTGITVEIDGRTSLFSVTAAGVCS